MRRKRSNKVNYTGYREYFVRKLEKSLLDAMSQSKEIGFAQGYITGRKDMIRIIFEDTALIVGLLAVFTGIMYVMCN